MSFGELSNSDRDVIRRSLAACADGPFFEDWEFRKLFGLTRPEFREAASSWDAHEEVDPRRELAIHNALGALLGYPHGKDGELDLGLGLSRSQIAELFRRWRTRSSCRQTAESVTGSEARGREPSIMRLAVQIVLLVATLGWLGLIVFGSALAFPAPAAPRRDVVQELRSPSGHHVATLVEVSGGGAAGYHYQEVSLRGRGSMDHVQVANRLYGATLRWLDDAHLEVGYDSGKPGREEVDGVAISYHPGRR